MKSNVTVLKNSQLFSGIDASDIESMLKCLSAKEQKVSKDAFVFVAGDTPEYVGIVLSGVVHVIQEDYWGNRTILAAITAGGMFGEAFSCAQADSLPVSVVATEKSVILLIDCKRILNTCSTVCVFHARLIQNLLKVLASKNIMLTQKMEHITKKTTREKVLSYLSECAINAGRDTFEIPFNRQELADYLSVERSALSYVLSKMKTEGILEYHKNTFSVLRQ